LYPRLYPELSQYMGLSLNEEEVQRNLPVAAAAQPQGLLFYRGVRKVRIVRVSSYLYIKSNFRAGFFQVSLNMNVATRRSLNLLWSFSGIFVQLVQANSPASLAGLRFGDQVLQINSENCAGWSSDKAHKVLKQASGERISMIIRDRPFERIITMHKDSTGHVGFIFKNGKITSIVKDSSAARNGLLTEHNICEINGQNIIGLKDPQIADILATAGNVVTITVMPSSIYEYIIKRMATSIMKNLMDHSVPEV
ncbi:SDCB1 protein, partial [Balaeniceps rex]|nr:SDCB1 protein [Balaeniceps rex]